MKYEKFKIVNLVKDLIVSIDKNLVNFPKREIELKKEITTNAYNLLLVVYEGNVTTNIEKRQDLQEKAIAKLKYLDFLGVMPILDSCSLCGTKVGIITLNASLGGYICKNCYHNEPIYSKKTIQLLRMFYYVDISKIATLEINEKVQKELNTFLEEYYEKYTGLYLKSKNFLKNIHRLQIKN